MKKKNVRTKWNHERAKILDDLRKTSNLTWEELGKKEGMSAAAVKHSLQKWLKRAPLKAEDLGTIPADQIPKIDGSSDTDRETFRRVLQKKVEEHKRAYDYWAGVQLSELME